MDEHSTQLPGRGESLWMGTTPRTSFDALDGDTEVEAAVVGGGIVGVTAAVNLAEAGVDVTLLERDRVVEGTTGHTTAKLTAQHGLIYDDLVSKFDIDTARKYADANSAVIEAVADRVDRHDIDCEFERKPAFVYAETDEKRRKVREEVDAARRAGLDAAYVEDPAFPTSANCAERFDDQAQFHPRKYLLDLVDRIPDAGGRVYEQTRVDDIDGGSPCRVETESATVTADSVVVASHFPVYDHALYFARLYPKRSYVLAVRTAEEPPEGMYYRSGTPYFSVRSASDADGPLTLVGGQNHKTGQGGRTGDRYRKVASMAREHFDVESVEYRWSTQDYVSVDRLPVVGKIDPSTDNVYVASGFAGWGMTNGVAAGHTLAGLVRDDPPAWADAFDPNRFTPTASAHDLLTENANVASHFVRDRFSTADDELAALAPGDATVTRIDGDPVAAYRDEDGELHAVSAVCTHLDCIVEWNDAEQSWDCPCHGSRFDYTGEVLDTPAVADLPEKDI